MTVSQDPCEIASILEEHDRWVEAADDVDRFCSSSLWLGPARRAFTPDSPVAASTSSAGSAVMQIRSTPVGPALLPMDAVWALGAGAAGSAEGAVEALRRLLDNLPLAWAAVLVSGFALGSPVHQLASRIAGPRSRQVESEPTTRLVASLDGGFDGYLSRRSRKHRATMRRASSAVGADGVELECFEVSPSNLDELLQRVDAVERRSWKSLAGAGVADGPMHVFVHDVLRGCAHKADLVLVVLATRGGRDVGYLHGAALGGTFRGLQMSFDAELRELGLGNALQTRAIEWLAGRGCEEYDLGSALPYKYRWAEREMKTGNLWVLR
ncbi:MAG: GNAT family N-acetyltransferase [Myxococcales bacterium]|nr:GNAT family N-acetyltransferase [Myxococcales bacterium]